MPIRPIFPGSPFFTPISPIFGTRIAINGSKGAFLSRYLKKLGYQIQIYSSADLRFYGMDKLLFGENRSIADKVEEFLDNSLQPCDRDALAIDAIERDLQSQGNVYIFFLDGTHSEYSFPKEMPLLYEPISQEIDYLTIGPKSIELEWIKNRYRNSIHYLDSHIGRFIQILKTRALYDDAIIAITGDHGEEFFEEGAPFHGTHLNSYQMSVPIYLKFPSKDWIPSVQLATHIQLFPSILHYLTKQSDFSHLFDGESIFKNNGWSYHLAFAQNGPDTPVEFILQRGQERLHACFKDEHIEVLEQNEFDIEALKPLMQK